MNAEMTDGQLPYHLDFS